MIDLKDRLNRLYRFVRYGERHTCVEFESKIVECQFPLTSDLYECENCLFQTECFLENKEQFFRYLKRNDRYKDGTVREMDSLSSYPSKAQEEIRDWRG
jgi:hypothetical protein